MANVTDEIARAILLPSRFATATCKAVFGYEFEAPAHILEMERSIVAGLLDDTEQSLLQINTPPRYGKSLYMMFLCAWILGHFPDKRLMFITYSDDFSAEWGRKVRDILKMFGREYFGISISKDNQAAADWKIAGHGGGMLSVGIMGNVTGRDADVIIVDDVIKGEEDARSMAMKNRLLAVWDGAIRPRLEPTGTLVLISTRWAEDDLPGTLESREADGRDGDTWTRLVFPSLAEPGPDEEVEDLDAWTDRLGRHYGDPLWPNRWPLKLVLKVKNSISPLVWATMHQQTPIVVKGGLFAQDNWGFYDPEDPPFVVEQAWMWDLATTEDGGDWTVGGLGGRDELGNIVVLDVKRFRYSPDKVENEVKAAAIMSGPGTVVGIEEERAGAGKAVLSRYKRMLPQWQVMPIKPIGKKPERFGSYASAVAMGRFLLPRDAEWLPDWIKEHRAVPRSRNDDQVDVGNMLFNYLDRIGSVSTWSPADALAAIERDMAIEAAQNGVTVW